MSPARTEPDESTYSGRIGKRIRELREAKKMALRDVVERMAAHDWKLTESALAHWELGRSQIPINALPLLAKVLATTVPKLLPQS